MGFASFTLLVWDHVDTFVTEVRGIRASCNLNVMTQCTLLGRVHLERQKGTT